MVETADTIVPTILSVSISLSDGAVLIACSETVDLSKINLEKIMLANTNHLSPFTKPARRRISFAGFVLWVGVLFKFQL